MNELPQWMQTLKQQNDLLTRLLNDPKPNDKTWRQNVTTVSANIADFYNEWLR